MSAEALKRDIISRLGREPENLGEVLPAFQEMDVSRNEYLLQPGEVCRYVYFIAEGCIQVYVLDAKGNESTREIYVENQWVTDIFGFQNQQPATEYIRCVEPSKLLRIHHASFADLAASVPQFLAIYRQILEVSYNNTVYRVNTLTAMDGLERLKWFRENKPRLMTRLSSKMIASYLGISPETMTRLKRQL